MGLHIVLHFLSSVSAITMTFVSLMYPFNQLACYWMAVCMPLFPAYFDKHCNKQDLCYS